MPADLTTGAPPIAPPAGAAAPPEATPRTEEHDWLFVGYPDNPANVWRHYKRNRGRFQIPAARPEDVWVADLAEVSRAAATLVARDGAGAVYPYLFVRPAVARALEDAFAAASLASWQLTPAESVMTLDLTSYDAVRARPADEESAVFDALVASVDKQLQDVVGNAAVNHDGMWPLRRGTLREIIEASVRQDLRARLFVPDRAGQGGWMIVLNVAQRGARFLTTTGDELVPAPSQPAAAPSERRSPSQAAEQPLGQLILAWLKDHPGDGTGAIATGIEKRKADVARELTLLHGNNLVEDRGSGGRHAWHVAGAPPTQS